MKCPKCNNIVSVEFLVVVSRTGTNGKILPIYPGVIAKDSLAKCDCGWEGNYLFK